MSILSELKEIVEILKIPIGTGTFSGVPPDDYIVLTPITDEFDLYADNLPAVEVPEVRISLFTKSNYIKKKNQLTRILLEADFVITDRRYIGHEDDTGYYHYAIDVAKEYGL